ncbi:MAG: hypothetical protein M0P41_04705 [Sphaerochaeta sp.]|nr:hypothetical protein [Sphaerochaeta sp.]
MKKSIWVVVITIVFLLLAGCDETTGGSGSSSEDEALATLIFESMMTFNYGLFEEYDPETDAEDTTISFTYAPPDGYDAQFATLFTEPPQFVGEGATVNGTLTLTGITLGVFLDGDESGEPAPDTEITISQDMTITGPDLEVSPTTIEIYMAGQADAEAPTTFRLEVNNTVYTDMTLFGDYFYE